MKSLAWLVCAVAAAALGGCNNSSEITGNISTAGNPAVAGVVVAEGGAPVAGARVKFYPYNHMPSASGGGEPSAVAISDAKGHFFVDSMPSGLYTMVASSASLAAFDDSIGIVADSSLTLPTATMRAPGSLRGRVRFRGGEDVRTVQILVLGTSAWTVPLDTSGEFTIPPLAAGSYRVRFLSGRESYPPLDTVLSVVAGTTTDLSGAIILQSPGWVEPPAAPQNFRATIDTALQMVTLSWDASPSPQLQTYNIYFGDGEKGPKFGADAHSTFVVLGPFTPGDSLEFSISAVAGMVEGEKSPVLSLSMPQRYLCSNLAGSIAAPSIGAGIVSDAAENRLYVPVVVYDSIVVYSYDLDGTLIERTPVAMADPQVMMGDFKWTENSYFGSTVVSVGGVLFAAHPLGGVIKIDPVGAVTQLPLGYSHVTGMAGAPQGIVVCNKDSIFFADANGVIDGSKTIRATTSTLAGFAPLAITRDGESSYLVLHKAGGISRLLANGTVEPLFSLGAAPSKDAMLSVVGERIIYSSTEYLEVYTKSGTLIERIRPGVYGSLFAWGRGNTFYCLAEGNQLTKVQLQR